MNSLSAQRMKADQQGIGLSNHYRKHIMKTSIRGLRPVLIAIALASAIGSARADEWTGTDKTQHFIGSALIAAGVTSYTGDERIGFWSSVAVGVAKEVYDYDHPAANTASLKDLTWDVLGAYMGARMAGWSIRQSHGETVISFSRLF